MPENDCEEERMEDSDKDGSIGQLNVFASDVEKEINPVLHERSLRKRKKIAEEDLRQLPPLRRGRLDLSLREKIKILEMLDANPKMSQRRVSVTFNVSQSQISRIKNNKICLMKEWQNGNWERKRKRIGKGGGVLEDNLLKWYKEAKKECIPLSGPLLMEKAKEIALEQRIKFTPTSGWFGRWKVRHSITLKGNQAKDLSMSYSKLCHHWRRYTFTKLIKNFNPDTIWFLGETNLYFNATVNNVRELNDNKLDQSLQNINLLLAFSSNGVQRRKPLVVGMEKIANYKLPVFYYNTIDGQITKEVFSDWLVRWDNELRFLKINIILFLQKNNFVPDNLRLNCITLHFYPEGNCEEQRQIQPFNHDTSTAFISLYRYQIVFESSANELLKRQMTSSSDLNGKFISLVSSSYPADIQLIDALYMLKRSYDHLNPDILVKGVVKAGLSKEVLACSADSIVSSPPMLTDEEFRALVSFESLANAKSLSVVPDNHLNNDSSNTDVPAAFEVLSACQILKKFMHKELVNHLDRFAEIEANILDKIFNIGETCSISHPLYSIKSVQSFHSHKNTLNKRQSTSKILTEQKLERSNGVNEVCLSHYDPNSYEGHNDSSSNVQSQMSAGVINSTKYRNEFLQTHPHQSPDYSLSNLRTQSNVDVKNLPIAVPRSTDLHVDPEFAFRTNLQNQPRTLQELNPHILPVADVNNHTPTYFAFAPRF